MRYVNIYRTTFELRDTAQHQKSYYFGNVSLLNIELKERMLSAIS